MKREAIATLSSGVLVPHHKFHNKCLLDIHVCEHDGDVPLLDAHRADELLSHVFEIWVENFVMKGTLRFTTLAGRRTFEDLPSGVSIGTTFKPGDVVVVDRDGREQDFDAREWREYHQEPGRYCTCGAGNCLKSA